MRNLLRVTVLATIGFLIIGSIYSPSAQAGQLSALGSTVSWEESDLYSPLGTSKCFHPVFQYSNPTNGYLIVSIQNKFGVQLGSSIADGSGQTTLQLCDEFKFDYSGMKVVLDAKGPNSESIVSTPITLVSLSPTPAPTVTVTATSLPAPTVTVTATPLPAPTVTVTAAPLPAPTVTAYADAGLLAKYNDAISQLASYKNLYKSAISKFRAVCTNKPKPRGC
jgi:hypothetical protein